MIVALEEPGMRSASAAWTALVGTDQPDDLFNVPGMHSIVVGISKDPNAKIVVLLIRKGATQPEFVVKVPTTDIASATVRSEIRTLTALQRVLPEALAAKVPSVEAVLDFKGRPALVISALPGSPMTTSYHRWRHTARRRLVAADFEVAERWLAGLQETTAGGRQPVVLDGIDTALQARFAGDPALDTALAVVANAGRRLATTSSPRTAVHGDFWAGNIILLRGQLGGVVDWEAGTIAGEPVRDLVRFALTYALYLDRHSLAGLHVPGHPGLRPGTWGAGIEYALAGRGWFAALFRDFLIGGLSRLGSDPGCWRDAVLMGVAEVAAVADHMEFGREHLRLLARLARA